MDSKFLLTFALMGLPNYQWFDNQDELAEFIYNNELESGIFEAIEVKEFRLIELDSYN